MPHYTYLIQCQDSSLYCGYTSDLARRMEMHRTGKGAKYTRAKGFVKLHAAWRCTSASQALKLEYRIKQLSRAQKLQLAATPLIFFPASMLGILILPASF